MNYALLRRAILLICTFLLSAHAFAQSTKAEMLLYCGITMVRPMTEIAQLFEQRENIKIAIAQGGSEDLYQSAKKSGVGDWYLPGEPTYREKHLKEGLFAEHVVLGYNQMALMVQKGNPKKVKADPNELLRRETRVILGAALVSFLLYCGILFPYYMGDPTKQWTIRLGIILSLSGDSLRSATHRGNG